MQTTTFGEAGRRHMMHIQCSTQRTWLISCRDCVPRVTVVIFNIDTVNSANWVLGLYCIYIYLATNSGYTKHLGEESVNVWYSLYAQYSFYSADR